MITAIDEKLQVLMMDRNEIMAENQVDLELKSNLVTELTDKTTKTAEKAGFTKVNEMKDELRTETNPKPEDKNKTEPKPAKGKPAKEKTEKKGSVKNKIQEGRDTVAKTSSKKTTKREAVACV